MQTNSSIQSTVGVDCSALSLADGEVTVWDFAGQQEYTVTHQFFLSLEVIIFLLTCLLFTHFIFIDGHISGLLQFGGYTR